MRDPEGNPLGKSNDDGLEDDVSLTSTVMSDMQEEYAVDRILAEKKTARGREWLVKWEGYPEERSTWEPKSSFTSDVPLFEWQSHKMRIARGYEKAYDVAAFEERVRAIEQAHMARKAKRRAKRISLGIRVSPDVPDIESSNEAEESEDEIPVEKPSRSRSDSLRKADRWLGNFVAEDGQHTRKGTTPKTTSKSKKGPGSSSSSDTEDQFSEDSLIEDLKRKDSNRTHQRPKKRRDSHGDDDLAKEPASPERQKNFNEDAFRKDSRSPPKQKARGDGAATKSSEPPARQLSQVHSRGRSDADSTSKILLSKQAGSIDRAKSQRKGAVGIGPKRFIKKLPPARPKVQGAAILGNWTAAPQPRKRTTVGAGTTPSSNPKTFHTLSVKRRFEKAGRNEPAPNPENLIFIDLKKAKVLKPPKPPSPPKLPPKSPWDTIQESLRKGDKEPRDTERTGKPDPETDSHDLLMDSNMYESPEPIELKERTQNQEHDGAPIALPQSNKVFQPNLPPPTPGSGTVQSSVSDKRPDLTTESSRRPSLSLTHNSSVTLRDDDDWMVTPQNSYPPAPESSQGAPSAPDPSLNVLATLRIGLERQEMADVKMVGLDRYSRIKLLRTKVDGRTEICFPVSCLADDFRRYFYDVRSLPLFRGTVFLG